jgi:hypothetical protein
MIHQKRSPLFALSEAIEDNRRHASPLADQHLALAPGSACVQVGPQGKKGTAGGLMTKLLIPIPTGLEVISVEKMPQASFPDDFPYKANKRRNRILFADAGSSSMANKNLKPTCGAGNHLSYSLSQISANQFPRWLRGREPRRRCESLVCPEHLGKTASPTP